MMSTEIRNEIRQIIADDDPGDYDFQTEEGGPGLSNKDVDHLADIAAIAVENHLWPLPMVLHCPECKTQHVDAPEPEKGWTNPPHKSHLCHGCGIVWRPADVPTNGVASIATRGERDTWPEHPSV